MIIEFRKGKYDTNIFCDEFTHIYAHVIDYNSLSRIENKLFKELSEITARFSDYEEDLKLLNVYYNEQQVKSKVEEVLQFLNKNK